MMPSVSRFEAFLGKSEVEIAKIGVRSGKIKGRGPKIEAILGKVGGEIGTKMKSPGISWAFVSRLRVPRIKFLSAFLGKTLAKFFPSEIIELSP